MHTTHTRHVNFRADLHCHTTCSDGSLTPEQLLSKAKEIGLCALSITDHDSIDAYQSALPLARELGILLGTGVEFSTFFRQLSVHVLAYDFPLDSAPIIELCKRHQERRRKRNRLILEKLTCMGMPVMEEELLAVGKGSLGRPHIAQLLIKKGYVSSIRQAFNQYIGDNKPAYHPGERISTEETLAIIHRAGGKAFIAHPHLFTHMRPLKELFLLPFDGIECYYAKFGLEQEKKWIRLAEEKKWLVSGGSDFHGEHKEFNPLGSSWVDEERFHQIFQRSL